jgi:hypothetical protein
MLQEQLLLGYSAMAIPLLHNKEKNKMKENNESNAAKTANETTAENAERVNAQIDALETADIAQDDKNIFRDAENRAMAAKVDKYAPVVNAAMVRTGAKVTGDITSYNQLWKLLQPEGAKDTAHESLRAAIVSCAGTPENAESIRIWYAPAGTRAAASKYGVATGEIEVIAKYKILCGDGVKGENIAEYLNNGIAGRACDIPYTIKSVKEVRKIVYRLRRLLRGKSLAEVLKAEKANADIQKLRERAEVAAKELAEAQAIIGG